MAAGSFWMSVCMTVQTQTSLCQSSLKDTIMDNSETLELEGQVLFLHGVQAFKSASMTCLWIVFLPLAALKGCLFLARWSWIFDIYGDKMLVFERAEVLDGGV